VPRSGLSHHVSRIGFEPVSSARGESGPSLGPGSGAPRSCRPAGVRDRPPQGPITGREGLFLHDVECRQALAAHLPLRPPSGLARISVTAEDWSGRRSRRGSPCASWRHARASAAPSPRQAGTSQQETYARLPRPSSCDSSWGSSTRGGGPAVTRGRLRPQRWACRPLCDRSASTWDSTCPTSTTVRGASGHAGWDRERRTLLHVENRALADLQEAFGSYSTKRVPRRISPNASAWAADGGRTHVIVALWSAEVPFAAAPHGELRGGLPHSPDAFAAGGPASPGARRASTREGRLDPIPVDRRRGGAIDLARRCALSHATGTRRRRPSDR
jgi:hypothetical protein